MKTFFGTFFQEILVDFSKENKNLMCPVPSSGREHEGDLGAVQGCRREGVARIVHHPCVQVALRRLHHPQAIDGRVSDTSFARKAGTRAVRHVDENYRFNRREGRTDEIRKVVLR